MKYKQVYFKHFGYVYEDFIPCEVCGARGVDIHHIKPKGMGGRMGADRVENLIALCRNCHIKAHNKEYSEEELNGIHLVLVLKS